MKLGLDDIREQLRSAGVEAERIICGLSVAQINWQPEAGKKWSVAQCLDHLRITADGYERAIRQAVAQALAEAGGAALTTKGQAVSPGLGSRAFVYLFVEPPARVKVKTLPTMIPASQTDDPARTLREFSQSVEATLALVDAVARVDVNRVRFASPFAAKLRFTVGTPWMASRLRW